MVLKRKYPELAKLKGLIKEKGTSNRRLAPEVGMAPNTLGNKLNGFYAFEVFEMEKIALELDIDPRDIALFFMPGYCETQRRF